MEISKFKSRKEWVNYVWAKLLKDLKNPVLNATLNSLLSSYEKQIIVNRLAALILIKEGKTYKQIGEELWLSSTTIRSLKKILQNNSIKEYQSYRLLSNERKQNARAQGLKKVKEEIKNSSAFLDWLDYWASVFPKKHGSRWKFIK